MIGQIKIDNGILNVKGVRKLHRTQSRTQNNHFSMEKPNLIATKTMKSISKTTKSASKNHLFNRDFMLKIEVAGNRFCFFH